MPTNGCRFCLNCSSSIHFHRVPPPFSYGIRQSALVQCSPSRTRTRSRRLILPAPRRYFLRFPTCDFDHVASASEVSTASIVTSKTRRASRYWLGGLDAAEAMISLLSEEVDQECLGSGERTSCSYKMVDVDERKNYDAGCYSQKKKREQLAKARNSASKCNSGKKKRMQVEASESHVNERYREKNRNVGSNFLETASKHGYESINSDSREESSRNAERESYLKAEYKKGRTKSTSCSSYYSLSSSGDLESDTELPDQEEQFVEDSLSGHVTESIRNENSTTEGRVVEVIKRDNVDWDLRKKSEKKLDEVSVEELQSGQEYSRRLKNDGSAYMKTSHKKQLTGGKADLKVSEIQDSAETISTLQRQSESRRRTEEEARTLVQSQSESKMKIWEEDIIMGQSSQTRRQQQARDERIAGQLELRRKSEYLSETDEAENRKTSIVQSELHKKKQDDTSSLSFSSNSETKKQCFLKDQTPPQRIESRKGLQAVTNLTVVHADNIEVVTSSQTSSGKKLIEGESTLTSGFGLMRERRERHNETSPRVEQMKSRKETEKPSTASSAWEKADEASSFQASLSLVSEAREQQSNVDIIKSEKGSTQALLMPPRSHTIAGGLQHNHSATEVSTQEVSVETSESGSAMSYVHSKGRTTFSDDEPYSRERRGTYGESMNVTTHEDSLSSAQRLEESSLLFVGEFVEKARCDVLTSEVQQGKRSSDSNSAYGADKHRQKTSGQHGKEELKMKKHDSRQSSKGSGAKGPSDEMWDVTDPSVLEPPEAEITHGTSTSEHAVMKRTGRSLWSLMADIVRLRWGSRAQTPSSAARSRGRTSPNESVGSETWFSGREPDENSEENLRRERSSTASEVISLGTGTQGEGDASGSMRSEKIRQLEGSVSPSLNILETGSASEGISLTSQKEKHDGSSLEIVSSGKEVAQSAQLLPARSIRRSPVVEQISETDIIDIHGSGSGSSGVIEHPLGARLTIASQSQGKDEELKQSSSGVIEHPLGARLTEASQSQGKDGELKQRRLQRAKQVPRDRFDEWDEAYTLEREQRKLDEMFMKEALLEAKKAAESWEVPVGAVLVQHGKIIARGRNLVEELRDSTAHAEMICIREASNTIRSWRLADATLYVTLEPCPMCAGAILQARIDTLVWGAPNKLLGADGSWIRLFPDGREGGNGSASVEKPAPPVHPFHPKMTIRRGILASECADIMQQFFQLRRKKKENNNEQAQSPSCLPITSHPSKLLTKMHDIFNVFCL
ncbi:CMP/dCMP deaminase, zinc-binding protein [Corchorus olitorius]|uniref:tRNA(adenine(34)) deaminase n=1 Tax=Corchorus olitorius TaxID=93759 RepID=A0A1R3K581_9ROSI|nr:CMP/dCMP deaminase, zinc-binding protein [Corchorus olitorius]